MVTVERMMQAMEERDQSFEGIFYVCVKTTKIFCRPGCSAKTPKRGNVEFYRSSTEAIKHGYRPCKVCTPLDTQGETPGWIKELLREVQANLEGKLRDADLIRRGIQPNRVRRWFWKNHGMTFQAYQRSLLIGKAFKSLNEGKKKAVHAAYDSGYESLSGFGMAFKKATGFTPKKSSTSKVIFFTRLTTPLGTMTACSTAEGICLLEFTDRDTFALALKRIATRLNARFVPGHIVYFDQLQNELNEYFKSQRISFDVPLVFTGTTFQKHVWRELTHIPFGESISYKELSAKIGKPSAIRAVASANGQNPLAILVPCHRVIGSNGKLVGYGGGIHRKDYLLRLEKSVRQTTYCQD